MKESSGIDRNHPKRTKSKNIFHFFVLLYFDINYICMLIANTIGKNKELHI